MDKDEKYMIRALQLAARGSVRTSPNPMVGAVIVKAGRIIGEGFHRGCGLPHAEVEAIENSRRQDLRGAVMYVTLEPCDHFGRTPPCTGAIIASGISKIVVAMRDPNPINNGNGIRRLKRHGIEVEVGVLAKDAFALNKVYIKYITKGLPYVTVKIAQSIDGKIATRTGESRWITGRLSRRFVHKLRGMVDGIMVGVNTVVKDDPSLMSKLPGSKQPVRIVVDSDLRTPFGARIFRDAMESPVIIATSRRCSKINDYEKRGATVVVAKSKAGRVDIRDLFKKLADLEIAHILVEGGGELIASVCEERLADRFLFFIAPKIIGGTGAKSSVAGKGVRRLNEAWGLKDISVKRFDEDLLIEAEAA